MDDSTPAPEAAPAKTARHEDWAKAKATAGWVYAGVKAHLKLEEHQQVTEEAFDEACAEVASITIG